VPPGRARPRGHARFALALCTVMPGKCAWSQSVALEIAPGDVLENGPK